MENLNKKSHRFRICPICECSDIEYGIIEIDDFGVFYPAKCNNCGFTFNEVYNLDFLEHTNIVRGEK